MRAGDGKKATAPCGHSGEHVTPNYVACLRGCDEVARASGGTPAPSSHCPRCRSASAAIMVVAGALGGVERKWHCWDCGAVWSIE